MNKRNRYSLLFIPLLILLLVSACITSETDKLSSTARVRYQATNLDQQINDNQGILNIQSVHLVFDNIGLVTIDDTTDMISDSEVYLSYFAYRPDQFAVLTSGNLDGGVYTGLSFELTNPTDESISNETNSAITINGIYNADNFRFTSTIELDTMLAFNDTVTVEQYSDAFLINLFSGAQKWFKDRSGNILDPNVAANENRIVQNIIHSFTVNGTLVRRGDDD